MVATQDRPTTHIPASQLGIGDVVLGFRSVPDREVMETVHDEWGTWVTYFDGVRDSFPPGYKVCIVL